MKTKLTLAITLAAVALGAASAEAQLQRPSTGGIGGNDDKNTKSSSEDLPKKFWEASIPGGNFLVSLSAIRNVSIHEYIVDGSVKVHEVVVATESSTVARFYHGELISGGSIVGAAASLAERAKGIGTGIASSLGSEEVWKKVQKNYPASTHSHTVEYRVQYLDDLQKLHSSVRNAWYNGVGTRFRIREEE